MVATGDDGIAAFDVPPGASVRVTAHVLDSFEETDSVVRQGGKKKLKP